MDTGRELISKVLSRLQFRGDNDNFDDRKRTWHAAPKQFRYKQPIELNSLGLGSFDTPAIAIGSTLYLPDDDFAMKVKRGYEEISEALDRMLATGASLAQAFTQVRRYYEKEENQILLRSPNDELVVFDLRYFKKEGTGKETDMVRIYAEYITHNRRIGPPPPVWLVSLEGQQSRDFYTEGREDREEERKRDREERESKKRARVA